MYTCLGCPQAAYVFKEMPTSGRQWISEPHCWCLTLRRHEPYIRFPAKVWHDYDSAHHSCFTAHEICRKSSPLNRSCIYACSTNGLPIYGWLYETWYNMSTVIFYYYFFVEWFDLSYCPAETSHIVQQKYEKSNEPNKIAQMCRVATETCESLAKNINNREASYSRNRKLACDSKKNVTGRVGVHDFTKKI